MTGRLPAAVGMLLVPIPSSSKHRAGKRPGSMHGPTGQVSFLGINL
ncbi:MAG: hypothetical protein WA118_03305 [Carboxydocellales bacterium]